MVAGLLLQTGVVSASEISGSLSSSNSNATVPSFSVIPSSTTTSHASSMNIHWSTILAILLGAGIAIEIVILLLTPAIKRRRQRLAEEKNDSSVTKNPV